MTYEEFKDKVKEILGYDLYEDKFSKEWVTGGMTGGSCWNSEELINLTAESEPEFDALDTVLEAMCPSISFLTYKKLMQLVSTSERTSYEYYGNFTEYTAKSITLREVYDFLVERNLI